MNSMKRMPTPLLAPEGREVDDLVVVDAAHHDAVDLHRVEPGVERGVDSGEHPVELVAAGEREEHLAAQRVERDVDAPQPGGGEVVRHLGELHAVGGHGEVDAERGEQLRRAAAGGPGRVGSPPVMRIDSNPNRSTQTRDDAGLLLVGEELVAGQPVHALLPACSRCSGSCSGR